MARAARMWLLAVVCVTHIRAQPAQAPNPGKLSVTVVDSIAKQPIANASVILQNLDFSQAPRSGQADDRGIWEAADLDPGKYFLDAHAIGSGYRTDEALPNFSISAGQLLTQTILLTPDGIIEGTITDQDGVPLRGIRVEALATANVDGTRRFNAVSLVFTDDRGQYKLSSVPHGRYFIKASQPSFNSSPRPQAFAAMYYPAGDSREQAVYVDVRPASTTKQIDFRLRSVPAFHIDGHALGLTAFFAEVFTIRPCAASILDEPSLVDRVDLQRDGSFHIRGLVPGIYCLNLLSRSTQGNVSRRLMGKQIVTVDRDLDDVRLTVSPAVDIAGVIKSNSNDSFPKPQIILLEPTTPSFEETNEVSIDEKTGNFLFSAKPQEDYKIHMYPLNGYQLISIKYGSGELIGGEFRPSNQSGPLVVEIAAAHGQLSGRVNYGTKFPTNGIDVSALREGVPNYESGPFHAEVDEQGLFQFTDLPPGSYRVSAFEGSSSKTVLELLDLPDFLRLFPSTQFTVSGDQESTIEIRMISFEEIARAQATF